MTGEAHTAAQALARVPAVRPDVLLAGAHLTDPDAPELCRQLRMRMPGLHILLVGVNAPMELIQAALRAGAAGVVEHTIDMPELVTTIEAAASGRTVMSTDVLTHILCADAEDARHDPLAELSGPDRELVYLVGEGLTNAEIAERLRLSPGTVRNYISRLLHRLGVERRAQITALAFQNAEPRATSWDLPRP